MMVLCAELAQIIGVFMFKVMKESIKVFCSCFRQSSIIMINMINKQLSLLLSVGWAKKSESFSFALTISPNLRNWPDSQKAHSGEMIAVLSLLENLKREILTGADKADLFLEVKSLLGTKESGKSIHSQWRFSLSFLLLS